VLLKDANAGNLPLICVKTGLPAEVTVQFVYDRPSRLSTWVTGHVGCFASAVLTLPVSLLLIAILAFGAFCVRHLRGTIRLPMTRAARRRLWIAQWIGPVTVAVVTGGAALAAAISGNVSASERQLVDFVTVVVLIAVVVWISGALWTLWVATAYLQPGAGVPIGGVRVLLKDDSSLGAYLELSDVSASFASAVSAQYSGTESRL